MSNQILQPGRALKVIPGDRSEIPFPEVMYEGVVTSYNENFITVSGADFYALGVSAGDIIYSVGYNVNMTIKSVPASDTLEVNWYPDANYSIVIYKGGLNRGCVLYVGVMPEQTATINVVTVGGSETPISYLSVSGFIPLQVLKVTSAFGTSNIVAFW